jgi:hypothetical protein
MVRVQSTFSAVARPALLALRFLAALLAFGLGETLMVGAADDIAAPSADTIFSRARMALSHSVCPTRIDYMISVEASIAGRRERNRFHAHYLVDEDVLSVSALSDEETRNPATPRGANIIVTLPLGIPLIGMSEALTKAAHPHDTPTELLGIPDLKPTYAFGLAAHQATSQPSPDASAPPEPRVIGSTSTVSRVYAVTLASIDSGVAGLAYHLTLTPLRDPQRNRIREMWIDAKSYAIEQIRTAGNFSEGSPTRVGWLITYQNVSGCVLIDEERALASLDFGPKRIYDETEIAFTVEPTSRFPVFRVTMPSWYDVLKEPDR